MENKERGDNRRVEGVEQWSERVQSVAEGEAEGDG